MNRIILKSKLIFIAIIRNVSHVIRELISNTYHWLIMNLPHRIMYRKIWLDSYSRMWIPRWRWSKQQLKNSIKQAEKWNQSITWE